MPERELLVFIPTYNERENVEPLLREILALGLEADVLFMDDGSPDGTGALLDSLAARHPGVLVAHRGAKLGIGSAHQDGVAWAYDHGYRRLLTMDCDFTHSPACIPELLALGEEADVVVGSRHALRESLAGWDPFRKLLTKSAYFATRNLLGIRCDATGAFRHYRLDRIPREAFGLVAARDYAFFFESLYVLQANGFSIREIPIILPARTRGHSKMSYRLMLKSVARLLSLAVASRLAPGRFLLRR